MTLACNLPKGRQFKDLICENYQQFKLTFPKFGITYPKRVIAESIRHKRVTIWERKVSPFNIVVIFTVFFNLSHIFSYHFEDYINVTINVIRDTKSHMNMPYWI